MIDLYKPKLEDLWFREKMMADEHTMSYNNAWGGTIPFPQENWKQWYQIWLCDSEEKHYYRYLYNTDTDQYVGEIAYHYDEARGIHICDVIVFAEHRNSGFGSKGIQLLCCAAKENGIQILYDDIAADNPSYTLFLKNGFTIEYKNNDVVMVKKIL